VNSIIDSVKESRDILRVIHVIDDLRIGGAQRLLVTFAEEAAKNRVDTTVITLSDDIESPIPHQLTINGVRVLACPAARNHRLLDFGRLANLIRLLKVSPADVVHTHLAYANILGAIAGKLTKKTVIGTLHGIINQESSLSIKERIEYLALRFLSDRVLSVGRFVAECYRPHLGKQAIITITNVVKPVPVLSPTERKRVREEITGDSARPLLLSLGRLSAEKGYDDLLNAFAQVRKSHTSVALAIAGGDGGLYADLQAQTQRLGLNGHAFLLGARTDVHDMLGAADIYICSSHSEGLPLSLLEAMSAGLPVISTRVGAIPEVVVTEDTGILVPSRNVAALSEAITALLDSPEKRKSLGEAAKIFIQKSFNVKFWFDRLIELYGSAN
jgi:glycosyltransferase involved in cell wall biosynthesis